VSEDYDAVAVLTSQHGKPRSSPWGRTQVVGTYTKPKANLHREFVYLNYESVLNSLSAFEAGQIDSIIEKTTAGSDRGLEAGIGFKGARAGASKKRQESIHEELVRTRTRFSAFESWYRQLEEAGALGGFDEWDMSVRDELSAGDTIKFAADIHVSPLFKLVTAFTSFTNNPGSISMRQQDVTSMKKQAATMEAWVSDSEGTKQFAVYFRPDGVEKPRIVGRLSGQFLISGLSNIEERYQVVAQVSSILGTSDTESLVRILKDAPPVPFEVETVT
jgi:hypothetical protein